MNPRRFALENLLNQCEYAKQLHRTILNLSVEGQSEKFYRDSPLGSDARQRRLSELKQCEEALEHELNRLVPAFALFGAGDYEKTALTLMGSDSESEVR